MKDDTTQAEQDLWRSFSLMRRQLELALERRLQSDAGISTADFEVLHSLFGASDQRLRVGQLGDIIGWEKSRVSHQITRMEQRGLVRRAECDADARGIWISLTPAGSRSVLGALSDRRDAVREYFFDVLTEEEKEALTRISTRVLDNLAPPICSELPGVARG